MTTETWLPVPGFEGFYEATEYPAAVRSLDRVITDSRGQSRQLRGKRMYPTSANGSIVLSRNGHSVTTTVDVVVARTFSALAVA